MAGSSTQDIKILSLIRATYGFVLHAGPQALWGTIIYALLGAAAGTIMQYQLLGGTSWSIGNCLILLSTLAWFAMALRRALGQAEKGLFGLSLGMDEWRLALSVLGALVAAVIIAFVLLVFLVIFSMILVAIAGYDADTLSDPAFFQSSENVQAFLATREGSIVRALGVLCLGGFLVFLLRLLPFPAGVIAEKRVLILQAVVWTRGGTARLATAALLALGPVLGVVLLARSLLLAVVGVHFGGGILLHLLACLGAFAGVGFIAALYERVSVARHE